MHEEATADPRQLVAQLRRERDEAFLRETAMASHAPTRRIQLYDHRHDEVSLDKVERIVI